MSDKFEKERKDELMEKYKLIVSARNFHYDNFSKWMTFFYIAIGALFLGYCTIISKENKTNTSFIEIIILVLGFLTSLFWYWSSKGYYYWAINFIALVNNYESKIFKWNEDERVYGAFANKKTNNNISHPTKGANISTSKIAILFAYIICLTWGAMLTVESYSLFHAEKANQSLEKEDLSLIIFAISMSIFSIWALSTLSQKNIESYIDHLPDLKIEQHPLSK